MKITADNKYELIDKYVKGEMNENEASEFSSIVSKNEELSAELSLIKELNEIQDFEIQEQNLKSTLQSIRGTGSDLSKYIKYAAALLILGVLMLFAAKAFKSSQATKSILPVAMIEPLELSTKDDGNFDDLKEMQDFYNAGNYKSALPYIEDYLTEKPKDLDLLLAKGIALMELNRSSEAHTIFTKIKRLDPRVKKYKWFIAINFLKQGQKQKAEKVLQEIVDNKSYNFEAASKLLSN